MSNTFESKSWLHQPLAIVGMSCRLPGGDGLEQFWDSLVAGHSSVRPFSTDRLDRALYYDSKKGVRGKTYSDLGGFVTERALDWDLLGLTPDEAGQWDPCHLNLCEVAARAVRQAGYDREQLRDLKTGVFVGHSGGSTLGGELAYRTLAQEYVAGLATLLENAGLVDAENKSICADLLAQIQDGRPSREKGYPRVDASYASALISRTLGLNGNSVSIDAACASSLVALALAANSLHSGESDVALVGGASFNKADSLILFSHAQSCSADGSRPFDEKANGLIGSEGYVVLVVKTLTQAEKDGDKIEAVIRGIGISSDGRGRSLWAPRKEGQFEAIERAYSSSVSPDSVQLIEAHATSTQVGDATEMEALSAFYSKHVRAGQKLPVGSVKSNIGHTLETAGLAGLLKSILAIQNKTVPPSIGIENLSSSIPWSDIPLYVPTAREDWNATDGTPRRAAVNAFGIGGLNVHVVVDEYVAKHIPNSGSNTSAVQPAAFQSSEVEPDRVAVIGRGLVLPGSRNLSEYLQAIESQPSTQPLARVENFEYDWRKHKVPPKQIAHANPLQFMLLDAAQQAFQDAGLTEDSYDRSRAAVVVGSPFGGDFGNSLFAGLRLPEFRNQLQRLLESRGVGDENIGEIVSAYEKQFLEKHPALLDETGSFTSSTLASRLSKTFNLMGGAMALDAGDCSGLAAISSGMQLLNSGAVDLVLCAAAHSALDAAAVENLEQLGRFKQDGSRPVVGEGVVLLLLQREGAARREGRTIHSLLHSASVSFEPHSNLPELESVIRDSLSTANQKPAVATGSIGIPDVDSSTKQALANTSIECRQSKQLSTTGYLQAVQPLAEIVEQTRASQAFSGTSRESQQKFSSQLVLSHTSNGLCHAVQSSTSCLQPTSPPVRRSTHADVENTTVFKFEASSLQELKQFLQSDVPFKHTTRQFQSPNAFRCVIASGKDDLARRSRLIGKQLTASTSPSQFVSQSMYWSSPEHRKESTRVAWMFPGQGSQYLGMLQTIIMQDPTVRADLDLANALIQAKCGLTFERIAWDSSSQLGDDYWHTQVSILVSNWLLAQYLRRVGAKPDAVVGHSFGEFSALLEVGCWNLEQAVEATWQRCQALASYAPAGMMMLGVQADSETVSTALSEFQDQVFISHCNAPQQTVIGGRRAAVIDASQKLEEIGVATRLLAVPTAFHTPALAQVGEPFLNALEQIPMLPAQGPILSGVNNRYVSDPTDIRQLLAEQLTQPIDFVAMIRRLANDGVNAFVEIGPQQVLTKLVKQILPDVRVFSCDHPKLGAYTQLQFTLTQLECMGLHNSQVGHSKAKRISSPAHFDATETRRIRSRNANSGGSQSDLRRPVRGAQATHFDATVERRERNSARREHALPVSSLPMETPAESATNLANASTSTTDSGSVSPRESLTQLLVDFVVEQTGYPEGIIELDWDIEADLGIDSIKKAQLFGELREFFEFEQVADFSLDRFKTLNEIVNLLEQVPAKRVLPAVGVASTTNASSLLNEDSQVSLRPPTLQAVAEPESQGNLSRLPDSRSSRNSEEEYTRVLVDFVVEQTGYPREIVELDADLEADLGIDSIKQAQLIGELRELFGTDLKSAAVKHASQNDRGFATLRAILEFLLEHQGESTRLASGSFPELGGDINLAVAAADPIESRGDSRHSKVEDSQPGSAALTQRPVELIAASQATFSRLVSKPSVDLGTPINAVDSASRVELKPFSGRFGVQPAIVRCLEHELISQCYWKPIANQGHSSSDESQQNISGESQPNGSTTNWFAELKGPEWLIRNRDEGLFELEQNQRDASHVRIAGSRLVHACVLEGRYAVVASAFGDSLEDRARFQQWFEALHESEVPTFESLVAIAKQNASENDCFCRLLDTKSGHATTVLSQNGVVELEDEKAIRKYRENIKAKNLNGASLAKIGFDISSRNVVLRTENDYGAQRLTIPCLNRGQASEKDSSTLLQLHSSHHQPQKFASDEVASRYVLRMAPAPLRQPKTRSLEWCGAAVIVGDNPIARQLEARLRLNGVQTYCLETDGSDDARSLQRQFEELAVTTRIPYLFLTTPWDSDAHTRLDAAAWNRRRNSAIFENFWLCQSWLGHVVEAGIAQDSQLVAMTVMGGDFGFGGNLYSTEGGALGGLLKSMLIETWTQGIRPLPIKVLDSDISDSPAQVVENLWQEINCPSYDFEVSYRNQIRHVVRAIPTPITTNSRSSKQPSGTFVCTGGARGITAYVAEQLALRYDLNLQLIGKSPAPQVHDSWKHLEGDELRQLKTQVMTTARKNGQNPVVAWQDTEKAIEIDATLKRLHDLGIEAQYHQCDVADAEQLETILATIRSQVGPIKGVLHGAGVGRDARFDRKQPEKVEQCIAAKVDGSIALMSATKNDPLEYFVGFGSISGRFGANGHTDYSLANEMLCKQIDWFAKKRPDVKAVGFHWHAWGDVGMATKPETRLALEMINMQFMPAAEGIEHLVQELESDSDETEVLITDDRYYRMFFPSETLVNESPELSGSQMRSSAFWESAADAACNGEVAFVGEVHPVKDPFLAEHQLNGNPLLPFVIAAEMMFESAKLAGNAELQIREFTAEQGLRFFGEGPKQIRSELKRLPEGLECGLYCDFKTRAGELVEVNRKHFSGLVAFQKQPISKTKLEVQLEQAWSKPNYPPENAEFFVGWPFQRLRKFAILEGGLIGKISAPALIELAGSERDLSGWLSPSAAFDSCLFATGILAWQRVAPGSALPASIGLLTIERLPSPGESLEVHVQLNSAESGRASFDFSLYGVDGSLVLNAQDYQVAWLGNSN